MTHIEPREDSWDARQRTFREFEKGVFNIMKLALAYDITPALCRTVETDIRTTLNSAVRNEMLNYTKTIDIYVTATASRFGWWWDRHTHKHMCAEITFDPYRMSLSVWTDPKEPGGIVCFQ